MFISSFLLWLVFELQMGIKHSYGVIKFAAFVLFVYVYLLNFEEKYHCGFWKVDN